MGVRIKTFMRVDPSPGSAAVRSRPPRRYRGESASVLTWKLEFPARGTLLRQDFVWIEARSFSA